MPLFWINIYMWEIRQWSLQGFPRCLQRYGGIKTRVEMSLLNKGLDLFLVFCIRVVPYVWPTNVTVKPRDKPLNGFSIACPGM